MQRFASATRIAVLAVLACAVGCTSKPDKSWLRAPAGPAPDSFRVEFTTTRGPFVVEAHRDWAPIGVDRFYSLVVSGFLDENGFYRVVPNFIVQFGAGNNPLATAHWDSLTIADDRRRQKNSRGTLSFAQEGAASRTHQLFINLKDNAHLDTPAFVPIGRVVTGMSVVDSIYSGYREKPEYHFIATLGNSYLERMFPKLDYIRTARVIPYQPQPEVR